MAAAGLLLGIALAGCNSSSSEGAGSTCATS
jgi:hypothetical protein